MIGKVFKHKCVVGATCEIIGETQKGYKVKQFNVVRGKVKEKIAYFHDLYFHKEDGVWEELRKD